MSAVFTEHAVDRMRERGITQRDQICLLETVERMATNPSELVHSKDVVRVRSQRGGDAFIVRAGEMRAVVTVDPARPEEVIVMSVYRADEAEEEGIHTLA